MEVSCHSRDFLSHPGLTVKQGLLWGSLAFALVTSAWAYVSYQYFLFSGDLVPPLSALLASVLILLAVVSAKPKERGFARFLLWAFVAITLFLGTANFILDEIQPWRKDGAIWARSINLNLEHNLPSLFSSYLLFLAGVMGFICYAAEKGANRSEHRRDRFLWIPVALGLCFLALDETLMFHERLNRILRGWIEIKALRGRYWLLVYGPLGLAGLALLWRFFYRRFFHDKKQLMLCISGILLWMLVPILEVLGGIVYGHPYLHKLEVTIEEMFEMWGSIAFLALFALYGRRERQLSGQSRSIPVNPCNRVPLEV